MIAVAKMKYGDMIKRLELIVNKLEDGDTELEDALKLFDEANTLVSKCNKILSESRLKITQLSDIETEEDDERDSE